MKKKIFRSIFAVSVIMAVIVSVLMSDIAYGRLFEAMKKEIKSEAVFAAAGINSKGYTYLNSLQNGSKSRITVIDSSGKVKYDNQADAAKMENHLDRPEIADAFSSGAGEAIRRSDTLSEKTYYYAVKLENGDVLRISGNIKTVYDLASKAIPLVIAIILAAVLISYLLAAAITSNIIKPINAIDLDRPEENEIYDELSPLLSRIMHQHGHIGEQVKRLKSEKEKLSAITENMAEGLVIVDCSGTILSQNAAAVKLLHALKDNYYGKNMLELSRDLAVNDAVNSALQGRPAQKDVMIENEERQVHASPVVTDGRIHGAVVLITDQTEKRKAEKQRREFSANVSHELKSPLTVILGFAELIRDSRPDQTDTEAFAAKIYDEAKHLLTLIDDIIELSRLDEGGSGLSIENIDLYELARTTVVRLAPAAKSAGVTLELAGGAAPISADPRLIEELLYNLIENAIKYNKEGGSAEVKVGCDGDNTVLKVSDTGIGIPARYQKRVFERFFRIDKSRSKDTGGTGLGLSIVKHVAAVHHASLELHSEEGKGTEITVTFKKGQTAA